MKKRKRILLIALLALIICGLGLVLFLSHEPPEPTYQGKPLSFWLTGYVPGQYQFRNSMGSIPPTWQDADRATLQMGTNCLPRLLRLLQRHDSPFKTRVRALLDRMGHIKISFFEPNQDLEAFHALCALGSSASNGIPQLVHIYDTDSSFADQQYVVGIIGKIGPAARPAVPTLLRAAAHTNYTVRANAVWALGEVHGDAEKVVPVLMKFLNGPDLRLQGEAVQALAQFGTNAQPALPALIALLQQEIAKPSGTLQTNLLYAIGQIHADADKAVPVLMICLNNTDRKIQAEAIRSLGQFGAAARSATPVLVEMLHKQQASDNLGPYSAALINVVRETLESIDPAAAAKAAKK